MDLRNERGFTLVEVLIAVAILGIALLALMSMLSRGSLNVYAGGGQSKATGYARQMVEQLRNQPLAAPCNPPPPLPAGSCFPPPNGADNPERGIILPTCFPPPPQGDICRTWTVAPVGATVAPNRLWRITVTVAVAQNSQLVGGQNITIETMRAE